MSRTTTKLVLLLALFTATGCGTMGNLCGRDHIYGGTVIDANAVGTACKDVIGSDDAPHLGASRVAVMLVCGCIDLPLSVAADTVTLPITVSVTCYHWLKPPQKTPAGATPTAPSTAPPTDTAPPPTTEPAPPPTRQPAPAPATEPPAE
jgi:hypothetical protein